MTETSVLIIGGGISGLSTAWWLAQQGISVEVWEADDLPGGKIRTTSEAGYTTERAAGLLVNFRNEIDQMIQQAGLSYSKRLRDETLNRYVVHNSELTQVPMLMPALLASPLWSLSAKFRLMTEIMIPRSHQEDETVSAFIKRRLGREILDTAIDPFVSGTLASDPDLAEARSVLPRLKALEKRYGSLTMGMLINRVLKRRRANKAETFSFSGGMSELIRALADTPGVTLRCGMQVESLMKNQDYWQVTACNAGIQHQISVPHLVMSTPADIASGLLKTIDESLSRLLSEIEYVPIAVLHLGIESSRINHPLDGTGFLVSRNNRLNFNGNLWMSRLFPERAPSQNTLLTTYLGGVRHPEQIDKSDEQLTAQVLSGLKPLLGINGSENYIRIDRHEKGLPLYHGQYQARLEKIESRLKRLPGLHLNANYQNGVSVRERIFQGHRLAQKIAVTLKPGERDMRQEQPFVLAHYQAVMNSEHS
ncbi:MAG: protoporphyrinogen oxidase [Candidatus Thiodiazotropha sp. (ex Dulcina madagascariensis)]|nr:protoporphyrinogen oxidase [Candidatus Thiodiazotropha sp. (ex Dulcina madagascariensis)]